MDDRSANLRAFFARYVTVTAGANARIEQAFAAVKREPFAGPGPWSIHVSGKAHIKTPDDDPAFLYQNTLVALDVERGINIGEPSSHARWLNALDLKDEETVIQVGAGTGYYTAIIAHLVGPCGRVYAYEIDPDLASRARENLKDLSQTSVAAQSGIAEDLPEADAIYVCAGITQPSWLWLDALRPGGRLLFPLQPERGFGGMLRIERRGQGAGWPAKFISRAAFIACAGMQDADAGRRLAVAFSNQAPIQWHQVRSFRTDTPSPDTCWYAGEGWWLSSAEPLDEDTQPRSA